MDVTGRSKVDSILVSVVQNALEFITKEMGQTMLRTSMSPIFSEARDFVTAIFDEELRLVAQTAYIPVLLGATPWAVRAIAGAFENNISDGDIFLLNDPFRGNNHPPDLTVAKPIFIEGKARFWAVTKAHHAGLGGGGVGGYNPLAENVWEEGLRIPPVRLYSQGKKNKDIWDLILINVHLPNVIESDLHCQVGTTITGERRLKRLIEKYGWDVVKESMEEILRATERQMRARLREIHDGVYEGEAKIDNDGVQRDRPVTVRVNIKVEGSEITFDFAGTDEQARGFVNSPFPNTASSVYLSLFSTISPDVKLNEGSLRPIKILAPEKTLVNPVEPAATTCCTLSTCEAIVEAIWKALAKAVPDKIQAGWCRSCAPATTGINPNTGRPFVEIHFICQGGGGANDGYDGWDHVGTVVALGGARSPDPELHELVNPFTILEYELLPDSSGPGKWRGGFGVLHKFRSEADGIRAINYGAGVSEETVPFGLAGGGDAGKQSYYVYRSDGTTKELGANVFFSLNRGDVFEARCGGGGGYGDPRERPIEKVLNDVLNELVSIENAEKHYGVAISPGSLRVDLEKTRRLRSPQG